MAMVECKECGGQISQNADTCPHCGDVIREPKPKFSLVDLIHKISVPVDLAKPSPELSKFVSDQLDMLLVSSPRTALRVITRSAIQSLKEGNSLPPLADEQRKGIPPIFIVAADESQQMEGEKLAQALRENGINAQGVDVIGTAKDAKLIAPENLEIRFSKGANEESFLNRLAEKVKRFTGEEPKLVDVSTDLDPGTCEIWFSKR